MRSLACLLLLAACGSDPSASGVFPAEGFVGRELRVQVNGDNTDFGAGTTVDFGPNITVAGITVSSPTVIFADIEIGTEAAAGFADVTISGGGDTLTMVDAFELRNPVRVTTSGTPSQGGTVQLVLDNLDFENLFDTTLDPVTGRPALQIASSEGTSIFVDEVTEFEVLATAFFDVDAGPSAVQILSDGLASPGDVIEVQERAAIAVTPGTPGTGTLDGSALFTVTASSAAIIGSQVSTTDMNAVPKWNILPASGKWADAGFSHFGNDNFKAAAGEQFYFVVSDDDGLTGYPFQLDIAEVSIAALTPVAEVADNDISNNAQVIGATSLINASITDDTDLDFFEVDLAMGQTITIRATAGTGSTDTELAVFDDGDTELARIDADFAETLAFTAPVAGTYFISVQPSVVALQLFGYEPENDPYDLLIGF